MKNLNIALIEQPVIAKDIESLKLITEYSTIAILADEAVFSFDDAQNIIETKSANMINIKLMKCGGIYTAMRIAELCRKNGFKCMIGSMLEDPISIASAIHFTIANMDVIEYIDLDSPLLYKEQPSFSKIGFKNSSLFLRN
jgi:L-alanine-DL-glutamate epimerase-like enolase superfamily enzyme